MQRTLYGLILIFLLFGKPGKLQAQITVADSLTAMQLVQKLTGTGVIILNPVLRCPGISNGTFNGVSNLGIDSGVVLTSGAVAPTNFSIGIARPPMYTGAGPGAGNNGDTTEVDLKRLVPGLSLRDVCKLEFDFISGGNKVQVDYVFASTEYKSFSCSRYNDVFGFFISGPGYPTPTNIAVIPGTQIPVAVNSTTNPAVNNPTSLADCTAMGPGSPFAQYYVDNSNGQTISYWGFTSVFTAAAIVSPCDTYHFKLAIADCSDGALDSGVFLKSGSFSSDTTAGKIMDTTFCYDRVFPPVTLSAPAGAQQYVWDDGSVNQTRTIHTSGIFWARYGNCFSVTDTFKVKAGPMPLTFALHDDTTICVQTGTVLLEAPEGPYTYLWQDSSTARTIIASKAGKYFVTVTDKQCAMSDTALVYTINCLCNPVVPNAFTPNGDGRNDRLSPKLTNDCGPLENYAFRVFNRWGQLIYSSFSPNDKGWDGTLHNTPSDIGTYFYELKFTTRILGENYFKKGDVTLIR